MQVYFAYEYFSVSKKKIITLGDFLQEEHQGRLLMAITTTCQY